MDTQKRIFALDCAKVLAMVSVIAIHLDYLPDPVNTTYVMLCNRYAVNLFLLVNGFSLAMALTRRGLDTPKKYITQYLPRHLRSILWPFLVASVFSILYHSIWLPGIRQELRWIFNPDPPYPIPDFAFRYYHRISEILALLPQGGLGPGAYYIPLLVTLSLVYPIFYFCYRRAPLLTLAGWFALYAAGPWLFSTFRLGKSHFMMVVLGTLLYDLYARYRSRKPALWCGVFGAIFLLGILCFPTDFFSSCLILWGGLGLALGLPQPANPSPFGPVRVISQLGSATIYIYLAQKEFCATSFPYYLQFMYGWNDWALIATAFGVGVVFWWCDTRLTRWLFPVMAGIRKQLLPGKHRNKS